MSARGEPSPSFCIVPWVHRFVDERGFIKVCCVAGGPGNYVTDVRGSRMNIADDRRELEIFNSPRLKELRRKMLEGAWDPMCEHCRAPEAAGGNSSRTGRNRHLAHHIPAALTDTAPDGSVMDPHVRHLDMRLGNHCNLTCRMCTPGSSRLWAGSYNRVQPERFRLSPERLAALKAIDWVDSPAVWRRFREQLPHIEWLKFAGGEPMMIPAMIQALQMAVDEGCAGCIDLSYTTNATIIPDAAVKLWPRFRSVSLSCSVDGFGALNEYIRRPSRWADVDRTLRAFERHFEEWNLSEVRVGTTVQACNVLDLDRLYAYLRGFERVLPLPALNVLTWPSYLSVRTLPAEVRAEARRRLLIERSRAEYTGRPELSWLLSTIDSVLAFMEGDAPDERGDFEVFTRESEREFGDSLRNAAPDLAAALEGSRQP